MAAFRRALELGPQDWGRPHFSETSLREAERLAALESRLPAVLRGDQSPASPTEWPADFARLAGIKNHHAKAAELWAKAFAMQPSVDRDPEGRNRVLAACSAALAAGGADHDSTLTDEIHNGYRQQAIEWLNAELDAYADLLKDNRQSSREMVAQKAGAMARHPCPGEPPHDARRRGGPRSAVPLR